VRTLSGVSGGTRVYFNHAGNRLVAGGWGGALQLFDVTTGQLLFAHPATARTTPLRFRRDDGWLAGVIGQGRLSLWQLGDGREYRTLAPASPPGEPIYSRLTVHPEGRLLAAWVSPGVNQLAGIGFWDLERGDYLALVPQVGIKDLGFEPEPSGGLLTIGTFGSFRWPVRIDAGQGRVTIGPPSRLPLPPGESLGRSRDGRVLVSVARAVGDRQPHAGGWVMRTDRLTSASRLDPMGDTLYAAVDPEGRWVVTVRHEAGPPATVWDATDGRLIRQLRGYPAFSPDGRWLALAGEEGRLYATGSWEAGPRFHGYAVFSPDGKLLADYWDHVIRLVETDSGRELARLEEPNLEGTSGLCFTADGTRLITTTNGKARGVHVWDLPALRARLKEMELDWDAPESAPAPKATTPLHLEVLGSEGFVAAARAYDDLDNHHPKAAAAELEKALALLPQLDWASNQLARLYVLGPKSLRNAEKAVALAERAVQLCANDVTYKSTLGMAYYRAGRWQLARDTLEASLRDSLGWRAAHKLFFLAMCYHRLTDPAKAKECYDRAVNWVDERRSRLTRDWVAELGELRAEASALLGLPKP
jgi:WD40 repeat protein